ncbi:MAG: hypothetical protein AAFY36_11755, partial [Bacteroidota bacterium]
MSVLLVTWLGWTFLTNPISTRKDVEKISFIESEVSYRDNYNQLVQIDKKQGNDFLASKVKYAKV